MYIYVCIAIYTYIHIYIYVHIYDRLCYLVGLDRAPHGTARDKGTQIGQHVDLSAGARDLLQEEEGVVF